MLSLPFIGQMYFIYFSFSPTIYPFPFGRGVIDSMYCAVAYVVLTSLWLLYLYKESLNFETKREIRNTIFLLFFLAGLVGHVWSIHTNYFDKVIDHYLLHDKLSSFSTIGDKYEAIMDMIDKLNRGVEPTDRGFRKYICKGSLKIVASARECP